MEGLLNVNPGTIIWTIINFCVLLFIVLKFGAKPIANALKAREDKINSDIEAAAKANAVAQTLMKETQAKFNAAQQEITAMISKGREQSENLVKKAAEEAEKIKQQKVSDATREIERSKEQALKELRTEVATLVITATERILDEKLDDERHRNMIESYIAKLPNN
ncbi:MAG: atpF [Ignavibacteria bacterium]|nr:atpF [Ignavibacteria bacterium]